MIVEKVKSPKGAISIQIHNSSLDQNLSVKSAVLVSEAKIDSETNNLIYSFNNKESIELDRIKIIKNISGYLKHYFEPKDRIQRQEKLQEIQLEEILSKESDPDEILERLWASESG